jgi:glutamate-5-semialdehyde dehydrogenase
MHAINDDNAMFTMMEHMGKEAKKASRLLSRTTDIARSQALRDAAKALREGSATILAANIKDIENGKAKGLEASMLDRLALDESRIESIALGMEAIAALDNPVGKNLAAWERPSGLAISRVTVPLGVIGIIYESRPNVTADAGALCLKSGNVAILRGGSESMYSSKAIVECLHIGLEKNNLPKEAIQLVPTTDREAVGVMLTLSDYIDVIVPRGGKSLCKRVLDESRIPTLQHLDGNCHSYVHQGADIAKAVRIVENAKMRRTGICGATETLVVDHAIAAEAIPAIADALTAKGCELRGDEASQALDSRIKPATTADWDTEYLDKILAIKLVEDVEEAIEFINTHSSHHTDAIITEDASAATLFSEQIDSAIVMHNTSTQFADGGEFGMGAEIGISTGKLHARGPVGVEQLVTYKYVVKSSGAVRPA